MSTRKLQAVIVVAITLLIIGAVAVSSKQQESEHCSSCHEPYSVSWQESGHADVGCYDCHAEPGLKGWVESKLDLARMERVAKADAHPNLEVSIDSAFCLKCHGKASTINETAHTRIPHGLHEAVGLDCYSCHAGLVHGEHGEGPESMSHDTCIQCHEAWISDEESCMKCHKSTEIAETDTMVIPHATHASMNCGTCHGPMAPAEAREAYTMSHGTCIQCHEDLIADTDKCNTCHKPPKVAETAEMKIPHDKHAEVACGTCHGPQAPEEAKAAYSMSHDTCIACHNDDISDRESCMECHKVSLVVETSDMKIPHELHADMNCGTCHGPQAPEAAKKAYSMSHNTCIACHEKQISDTKACSVCHKGIDVTRTADMKIPHKLHTKLSCGTCHGPQAPAKAKAEYSMSHDTCIKCHANLIGDPKQCGKCHIATTVTATETMKIPHKLHANIQCGTCHGPQAPEAAKAAYSMSHDTCIKCHAKLIGDTRKCSKCHVTSEVEQTATMNIPHKLHINMECGTCHGPQYPASAQAAYSMSHDTCIKCHAKLIGDTKQCGKCHIASDVTGTDAMKIPHALHTKMECGACHGPQAPEAAKAAYSMSHDTCVKCHQSWIADVESCEKCHNVPDITATENIKIPHDLHSSMVNCGGCHGPMAPPAAKAAFTMGHDQCSACHSEQLDDYEACEMCHNW